MPAWKKHEAGRRGRDAFESDGFYDAPRREPAHNRIERLTRTATALGGHDRYPQEGGDDDLDAVADELDRLLADQDGPVARQSSPRWRDTRREAGVDEVMGALDRLDEQVQGLAGYDERRPPHRAAPRHRPGRYAVDDLPEDDYYSEEDDGYGYGSGYDSGYDSGSEFVSAPPPGRRGGRDTRANRETPAHLYKDLGRRIDALRAPQEQAFGQVREEIGSLRDALGGLSRGTSETVSRQNTELRRLSDMVERLRKDKKNDLLARDIRKEVAELKDMVGRTNVEGALQTLEHGYSHILQRLDELSRASVDPRVLRSVTARLGEIEEAFAVLPRSEHMVVLEDRVVSIAERMEELLQRKGHADIEPLRAELREVRGFVEQIDIKGLVEGIDDRMKFVSSRLDDLEVLAREQRGLDTRLSAMEERMPEPETISRLQGRLEDIVGMMADDRATPVPHDQISQVDRRLDEIVDRLERMERTPPLPSGEAGAFEALEKRLETISNKIDAIEKKSSRPVPVLDAAAMRAGGGQDSAFLSQLQERLNELTARLDQPQDTVTTSDLDKLRKEIGSMRASVAGPGSTEALEQRIADLAQVVSKGAEATDDGRFEQLGAKVSALADQIENTSTTVFSADQLSPFFERIEKGLEQTRADVTNIARKAAQEAVANAPGPKSSRYDETINQLQGDLKRLLDAAEGSEERTLDTFDGVKSVLGSLTERLDHLERGDMPGTAASAPMAPAASFSPLKVEEPAPLFGRAQNADKIDRAAGEGNLDGAGLSEDRARDRKADFIAAARRAAQAASAEAAQLEKHRKPESAPSAADEERGKERVGWLRNVLRRDKSTAVADDGDDAATGPDLEPEDISDRNFEAQNTTVLPGDRPAPEAPQASGGRRRAILYTAAAVVLLLGTLQVVRLTSTGGEEADQLASVSQETQDTGEVLPVTDPAETTAPAQGAPADLAENRQAAAFVSGANDASDASDADGAGVAGAVQAPASAPVSAMATDPARPATATGVTATAPAATTDPAPRTETVQTAAASAPATPETDLAFSPPSPIPGGFGVPPVDSAGGFKAPETGDAASSLLASLPPEGVGPMALRSAAAGGNPAAEFLVGVKYTEGSGVPADLSKAAVWYQKAADKGLAPAQYRLASLYEKGRGVEKDLPRAKAWYSKAAEAGNAKAMHNLAVIFAEGGGGQPDYAAAAKWFEAAANFGVKDSLFNLGILYAGGIGVDKDLVTSYKWFAIAADQGDPEAAKRRDDVANMMDQAMLANARLAVEQFALKTPDPAANKVTMEPGWADSASLPAEKVAIQAVDNTAMIRDAQDKLNYLGFETGTPDGQMGPRTSSAIRAFQRSLGLPETGLVDRQLLDELKSQAI
ncbi:peptidoglycan-binding protein [Roseibium sp.]|uniref:peptidoglycan-binding protein n=1 Tax=Roseibium sp. TaxID=1936156 RepID=UPI003262E0A2